jgi:MFS family permease
MIPTEKEITRSLNISIIASVFGMLFFMTITGGPLALMLQALGANGVVIGSTATLIQLGMLAQIPAAFYSERLSRRKPFWAVVTIFARAIWVAPGILILLSPEKLNTAVSATLIICGVFSIMAQMTVPGWFSWMADLIPENRRDSFWSLRQGYVMVASLIAVAFTGWFLDRFPIQPLFGFAWLLIISAGMGVLDVVVHMAVHEPPCTPVNRTISIWTRIHRPLENRDFLYFTLAMSLWMFGIGMFGPFLNVYLKENFDVLYIHLSALQVANMASGVIASFVAIRLVQHIGIRTFGLLMVIIAPLFHIFWFFLQTNTSIALPLIGNIPQPILLLFIGSFAAGGIYANVGMLQFNLLTALAPTDGRTMAIAVHWSVVGLISAAGPLIGGWIKDWFAANPLTWTLPTGAPFSYAQAILLLHALLIWAVVFPLFLKITPKDGEWPLERAMLHVFILNPLRAVRNVYNTQITMGRLAVKNVKITPKKKDGAPYRSGG